MYRIFFFCLSIVAITGCSQPASPTRAEVPEGAISVVEFLDFNCPACKAAQEVIRPVKTMENVYFEIRHLPLTFIPGHETSFDAAVSYECLADKGFGVEAEAALFDNQGSITKEFLENLPVEYAFDVDSEEYAACIASSDIQKRVAKDARDARAMDIPGTPGILVNGVLTPAAAVEAAVARLQGADK